MPRLHNTDGTLNLQEFSERLTHWAEQLDKALNIREAERSITTLKLLAGVLKREIK